MLERLAKSAAEAKSGMRVHEADGSELAAFGHVDGVDIVHGRVKFSVVGVSERAAVALMWYLVRWRISVCWLGLRGWLLRVHTARQLQRRRT